MRFNREIEVRTVGIMISMYCRRMHSGETPCPSCLSLLEYATRRIDHCMYGADKPVCASCPVHCYRKDRREEIRRVMRYAGPRMLRTHPVLALFHLLRQWTGNTSFKEMPAQ